MSNPQEPAPPPTVEQFGAMEVNERTALYQTDQALYRRLRDQHAAQQAGARQS